ncbi:MAG: DotA/TraY family protein [Alphaproteobacteria bacterium]
MFLFLLTILLCFGGAAPALAADVGLFDVANRPQDIGQQILDFVFSGSSSFFNSTTGTGLHNALKIIFTYYSGALMVFAVIIVFYHLIVIVGETAHTGIPFGKRNKQMWVPVRLVLALGLLVPVNGYNIAQYMIMQLARLGSGLASNAWEAFADTTQVQKMNLHGTAAIDPTAIVANLVAIGICAKSYEATGSGIAPTSLLSGMNDQFLKYVTESSPPVSRILFQTSVTAMADAPPVTCGSLTWVTQSGGIKKDTTITQVSAQLSKAHLEAIKAVQQRALDLGGSITISALGINKNTDMPFNMEFAALVKDYQGIYNNALRGGLSLNEHNMFSIPIAINANVSNEFGWIAAGATLQKFALTDTVLITPEMATPVVAFYYPLYAAANDKATLQISRSLSIAHLLLQHFDPKSPAEIWFNPQIDHAKGPFKQALTLSANILVRNEAVSNGRNLLNPGVEEGGSANIGLFRPIALGFTALDLADEFFSVAEWSPRANNPVFGPSILFGNMAHAVNRAFFSANPHFDSTQLLPQAGDQMDQPADFARYLLILVAAALFIPGILLVFILPLLPLIKFAIGGVIWLLAIIQGLAAAPIWALTFLSMRGDDMLPQASRLGVVLIFNIFLRPTLMIVGFIAALLLMHAGFGLLQASMLIFTFDGLQGSKTLYSLGPLVLLIANLILSFGIANASLKCIDILPEMTMRWLGTSAIGGGDESGLAGASSGGGNGGNGAGVVNSIAAAQSAQQVWQRKLLTVLEQMVTQSAAAAPQHNAGLFAHMADRPDQSGPGGGTGSGSAASGAPGATTVNATVVTAGATTHLQTPDSHAHGVDSATPNNRNSLTAQTIRGDPSSDDKS